MGQPEYECGRGKSGAQRMFEGNYDGESTIFWFGSLFADVAFITTFVAVSVLTYFYYRYLHWQQKQIPYLPPSFPFGNIKSLALSKESFGQAMYKIYRQFKDKGCKYGGFYMYSKPALMITDPDIIKSVLMQDFKSFHDRLAIADHELEPLAGNLFNTCGEKWRSLRRKITPTFTSGKMKVMFDIFNRTSENLVVALENNIEKTKSIDIKDIVSKYTIDGIASCVFGIEINALQGKNTEFRYYGSLFMQSTLGDNFKISFGLAYANIISLFRIRQLIPEIRDFFHNLLKTTIETREKNNIQRNDFIDMYIKMKKDASNEKDIITFDEFAAQAFLFFIAGYEPTAQLLTFCLYELSKHADIQNKLRDEIESVLEKSNGKLTYDSVFEMEYLDQIVKETLRLHPTADTMQRKCTESYKLKDSNAIIDKDTILWISILGLHKDPEYYADPEKFDPERFTKEEVNKRHPFTYLPFGEGPRNCIGTRFAHLQTKTGLISLVKNFKFILDPKTKSPLEISPKGLLVCTKDTVYLQATKIK